MHGSSVRTASCTMPWLTLYALLPHLFYLELPGTFGFPWFMWLHKRKPLIYLNSKKIAGETAEPSGEEIETIENIHLISTVSYLLWIHWKWPCAWGWLASPLGHPPRMFWASTLRLGDLLPPEKHLEASWDVVVHSSEEISSTCLLWGPKKISEVAGLLSLSSEGKMYITWGAKENRSEILRFLFLHKSLPMSQPDMGKMMVFQPI